MFTTLKLANWNDFKSFTEELSENWVFRGQLNTRWELRNAIERTDFIKLYSGIEAEFVQEFKRGARNYLAKDETPEHLIEWLALMQHHGAPTRLLDFSKSPFVAAFFAFEQCEDSTEENIAVWAINVNFLKIKATEVLAGYFENELLESGNRVHEALFEKIFFANAYALVFPVEPFRMNRRYSLQQSIFVSTGTGHQPFMEQLRFLGDTISKAVIKIELPAALQKEVLRDLQRMNLNRASLFPDLDGYAGSLRLRYHSMKSPEEALGAQLKKFEDGAFRYIP
jgi:hypothetical protein